MLPLAQAEPYFTSAIALNPHLSFYYSRRAAVYFSGQEYAKALKDQDETIRLNPNEAAYFNNRGLTHGARHDYDKAIQDFGEALHLKAEDTFALRNRGACWNNKKEYDRAVRDFTEAMQLDPREPEGHSGLASALAGKKQYAAAIASFENALRINDKLGSAQNGLAWLLATCPDANFRNGPKAVELARQVCEQTDWKIPGVIDTLAAAHAEAGQFTEAIRFQEQALAHKTFADNQEAQQRLRLYQDKKAFHEE